MCNAKENTTNAHNQNPRGKCKAGADSNIGEIFKEKQARQTIKDGQRNIVDRDDNHIIIVS